jgi:hypothetical protein
MNASKDVSHIAKFDGQNYSLWKLGLWVLLEQHNLIDIVTGDYTIPQMVIVYYSNINMPIKLAVKTSYLQMIDGRC